MNLYKMSARDAITRMRDSSCSSEELVTSCLKQIKFRENVVGVRAFLDEEASLNQSRQADRRMKDNNSSTPFLNWVPVGIKDIFDTRDMPTENGSVTCLDRRPEQDTLAIERLRNAGAVIMGKTVTAELAVYTPGKTTNPHDPARTPGGSSSGSAAAVASGMVPMATGMQKNGSLIGPASFCGVVGYKPTFGMIPWSGILRQAPSLDQVGVFTRNVGDSALLASVLTGRQECYSDTLPWPNLNFALLMRKDQSPSRLAFAKTPVWSESTSAAKDVFLAYVHDLKANIVELDLTEICNQAVACHHTIMLCEMAHNYESLYDEHRSQISPILLRMIDEGREISSIEYLDAKNLSAEIAGSVDHVLKDFSAVLTPSDAPEGLEAMGSPIFSTLWSLCGVPTISLPVLKGAHGMPLGLQLVSARGKDSTLLQVAQWLEDNTALPLADNERSRS